MTTHKTFKGQRVETVTTSQLREGDRLALNGCTMELGPISESRAHDAGPYGPTLWSKARVIEQHDCTIPAGWFDRDADGNRFWTVQGNDLATWQRIMPMFQIFDSLDRAACPQTDDAAKLYELCQRLNNEAEDEGSRLTYAIGKVQPDGSVTFDF